MVTISSDLNVENHPAITSPSTPLAKPYIVHLVDDTLLRIFKFCVGGQATGPIRSNDLTTFDRIAPDNVARVCRSWRSLTLSSPSLWANIEILARSPSDDEMRVTTLYIDRCLRRSGDSQLFFYLSLEGTFSSELSDRIVRMLVEHQRRWKDIHVGIGLLSMSPSWQASNQNNHGDQHEGGSTSIVPRTFELFTHDFRHLQALDLTFVGRYHLSDRRNAGMLPSASEIEKSVPQISSLTSLSLHMANGMDVIRWLRRAPNLKELSLKFGFAVKSLEVSEVTSDLRSTIEDNEPISLPNLQQLWIGECGLYLASIGIVLSRMVCPKLRNIDFVFSEGQFIYAQMGKFLLQSQPDFFRMHLCNYDVSDGRNAHGGIDRVLQWATHLVDFTYTCRDIHDFLELLMPTLEPEANESSSQIDSSSDSPTIFKTLPLLMNLKLCQACVPLARFNDFIAKRWETQKGCRVLKSVVLWCCTTDTGVELPKFKTGDDVACLPAEWDAIKQCITQGLGFQIGNVKG